MEDGGAKFTSKIISTPEEEENCQIFKVPSFFVLFEGGKASIQHGVAVVVGKPVVVFVASFFLFPGLKSVPIKTSTLLSVNLDQYTFKTN